MPFEAEYPTVKTCSEPCRRGVLSRNKTKDRKAECHPDRKHYSRGMCETCYSREKWRRLHGSKPRVPNAPKLRPEPRQPAKVLCGHADLPHKGHGLCSRCYDRQYKSSKSAACHPDRPHHTKGLCEACYRVCRTVEETCVSQEDLITRRPNGRRCSTATRAAPAVCGGGRRSGRRPGITSCR